MSWRREKQPRATPGLSWGRRLGRQRHCRGPWSLVTTQLTGRGCAHILPPPSLPPGQSPRLRKPQVPRKLGGLPQAVEAATWLSSGAPTVTPIVGIFPDLLWRDDFCSISLPLSQFPQQSSPLMSSQDLFPPQNTSWPQVPAKCSPGSSGVLWGRSLAQRAFPKRSKSPGRAGRHLPAAAKVVPSQVRGGELFSQTRSVTLGLRGPRPGEGGGGRRGLRSRLSRPRTLTSENTLPAPGVSPCGPSLQPDLGCAADGSSGLGHRSPRL